MKKLTFTTLTLGIVMTTLLSACNTTKHNSTEPMTNMANPASEYCIQQGGKLEIKKNNDGSEYALCHLPNGKVIEEWEFFRENHKN